MSTSTTGSTIVRDSDEWDALDDADLRHLGARGVAKNLTRQRHQDRARRSGSVGRWVRYTEDED